MLNKIDYFLFLGAVLMGVGVLVAAIILFL